MGRGLGKNEGRKRAVANSKLNNLRAGCFVPGLLRDLHGAVVDLDWCVSSAQRLNACISQWSSVVVGVPSSDLKMLRLVETLSGVCGVTGP